MIPDFVSSSGFISLARSSSSTRACSGRRAAQCGIAGDRFEVVIENVGPGSDDETKRLALPLKSGIRTSTDVCGSRSRISAMQAANTSAPPFGKSSRSRL